MTLLELSKLLSKIGVLKKYTFMECLDYFFSKLKTFGQWACVTVFYSGKITFFTSKCHN